MVSQPCPSGGVYIDAREVHPLAQRLVENGGGVEPLSVPGASPFQCKKQYSRKLPQPCEPEAKETGSSRCMGVFVVEGTLFGGGVKALFGGGLKGKRKEQTQGQEPSIIRIRETRKTHDSDKTTGNKR